MPSPMSANYKCVFAAATDVLELCSFSSFFPFSPFSPIKSMYSVGGGGGGRLPAHTLWLIAFFSSHSPQQNRKLSSMRKWLITSLFGCLNLGGGGGGYSRSKSAGLLALANVHHPCWCCCAIELMSETPATTTSKQQKQRWHLLCFFSSLMAARIFPSFSCDCPCVQGHVSVFFFSPITPVV